MINYQKDALRTCSPLNTVQENVSHMISGLLTEFVECLQAYDSTNRIEELGDIMWYFVGYCHFRNIDVSKFERKKVKIFKMDILYGISELTDNYKRFLAYHKDMNLDLEINNLDKIYQQVRNLCDLESVEFEVILNKNIEKLKVRFPNKFNTENALNRNLKEEYNVLSSVSS